MPPEVLPVLLQDRLPAYISWDQYLANQERLKQNRSLHETRGVPKRGAALLPGLVVCGKCGRHMATKYKADKNTSYSCEEFWRSALDEPCGRISATTLDDLVARKSSAPWSPPRLNSACGPSRTSSCVRARNHQSCRVW